MLLGIVISPAPPVYVEVGFVQYLQLTQRLFCRRGTDSDQTKRKRAFMRQVHTTYLLCVRHALLTQVKSTCYIKE